MLIRVGLDGNREAVLEATRRAGAAVLVSANNLWDPKRRAFRGLSHLAGFDVALDSGGFAAMKMHGGYRYWIEHYVALAGQLNPTWYAAMDFCCEPEITSGSRLTTWNRMKATAAYYGGCLDAARDLGVKLPMPVIQGWRPEDYVTCARMLCEPRHWNFWPDIVGIGSVCRRQLRGDDGLLKVVGALDAWLPTRIKFHLFGVKGSAIKALAGHPRFASMDSIAYDAGNRRDTRKPAVKVPRTNVLRAAALTTWYGKQVRHAHAPHADLFA